MHPQIGDPYEDGARRGQPRQRVSLVPVVDDLAARYNAVRMWWRHVIRAAPASPVAPGIPTSTVSRRFFYERFVSATACVTNPVRQIDLTNLQVAGRADAGSPCGAGYVPYPELGRASADGSTILYAGSSGVEFGVQLSGPEYIWSYNAASDTFAGPVIVADTPWVSGFGGV